MAGGFKSVGFQMAIAISPFGVRAIVAGDPSIAPQKKRVGSSAAIGFGSASVAAIACKAKTPQAIARDEMFMITSDTFGNPRALAGGGKTNVRL